jgi:peptidyl-prolyl cis-trans isomerase D
MSLMKNLRDNLKIIFVIIIIGFLVSIFAGLGSYFFVTNKNTAVIVNGERVDKSEYENYFNNMLAQKQDELKKDPTKTVDPKELKQEALRAIFQDKVLLQEAAKIGETVSDSEVKRLILQYPLFQKDGKFDLATYYKNLNYVVGKTPEQFEKSMGSNIKMDKVKFLIMNSTKVSKNELSMGYEPYQNSPSTLNQDDFSKQYLANKKMILLNDWFKNIAGKSKTEVLLKD